MLFNFSPNYPANDLQPEDWSIMNGLRKAWKRAVLLASSVGLAAGIGIAAAPMASAGVWNCSTGYASVGAWGYCANGDSAYFKVNVLCQNVFTLGSRVVSGEPERVGGQYSSIVSGCAWYERYYGNPWTNSA